MGLPPVLKGYPESETQNIPVSAIPAPKVFIACLGDAARKMNNEIDPAYGSRESA